MVDSKRLRKTLVRLGWRAKKTKKSTHFMLYCPCGKHLVLIDNPSKEGVNRTRNLLGHLKNTHCEFLPSELKGN